MDSMDQIKSILLFYFSGTGNARQVARWFSEFAVSKGLECMLKNIEKTDIHELEPFNSDTLIMIISPIHGFNFPKITLRFLQHLPKGKNNVVLMNTRAGMRIGRFVTPGLTGIAFMLSSLLLKRKGYTITGQIPFDMPSNWISIHPALNAKSVAFLHKENYARAQKHAEKVFSGKKDFLAYRDLIQDILIAPISLGYYLFGRFAFAKSFYATSACDHCGLCIKNCPVQAIKYVNDRPFWTFSCESCMKCMNACPKRAIETAHGLFAVVSVINSILITVLIDQLVFISQYKSLRFILLTSIFFGMLWVLYRVQHLALKNKFITKIISFSSLTNFKFWGRYRSIPDDKWRNTVSGNK